MLSKRYIPNQLQNLTYEEKLTKHYKKLEEIQKEDRKKKNVDKEVAEKSKFVESREKTIKFHISEKTNAIEKDNELLLGRLVEISRKKPNALALAKSEANLPRTLNGPSRRREKNRIAAENEAFARRLLSQQPSFNPKKLENDYEKHNQRVKNMAKITSFSPRKIRLPPIKYADTVVPKDAKKSKKDQKKKNDENEPQTKEALQVRTEGDEEEPTKTVVTNNAISKTEETEDIKTRNQEAEEAEAREKEELAKKEKEAKEKEAKEKEAREKEAAEKLAQEKASNEDSNNANENPSQPVSAVDNKSQVLADSQQPKVEDKPESIVEDKPAPNSATTTEQKPAENIVVEEPKANSEEVQEDITKAN